MPEPKRKKKPNNIRHLRLVVAKGETGHKIGLKELAEGSEISVPFLNKLEHGLVGASDEVKARIARYLDVSVEQVFPPSEVSSGDAE